MFAAGRAAVVIAFLGSPFVAAAIVERRQPWWRDSRYNSIHCSLDGSQPRANGNRSIQEMATGGMGNSCE
jgi:hypothetical protein